MPDLQWLIVLVNIAAMFIVILIGWVARRRKYLSAETTSSLSAFVVDVTIPAMVFTSMLRTIDPQKVTENWFLPLLGGSIILISMLVALLFLPIFREIDSRRTFIFLVGVANWIYLPLPIAKALYGNEGERAVLLFNVGAQVLLWTVGVWVLQRSKPGWNSLKNLITNPGLIGTIFGIIVALTIPMTHALETADINTLSGIALVSKTLVTALVIVGSLTIPLSLIVTGAQLGGLDISDHRISFSLVAVLVCRLLLAPIAVVAILWGLTQAGIIIHQIPRMVAYIISCMPVAVSCSMFTERFGGNTSLAARSIFYSTLLSIVTVPALFYLIQYLRL